MPPLSRCRPRPGAAPSTCRPCLSERRTGRYFNVSNHWIQEHSDCIANRITKNSARTVSQIVGMLNPASSAARRWALGAAPMSSLPPIQLHTYLSSSSIMCRPFDQVPPLSGVPPQVTSRHFRGTYVHICLSHVTSLSLSQVPPPSSVVCRPISRMPPFRLQVRIMCYVPPL